MKVSRITKFLISEGYIKHKRGTKKPAAYVITERKFPLLEDSNSKDQWDWSESFIDEDFGGHYNQWKMSVKGNPYKGWPWNNWDKIGTQNPPHHYKKNYTIDTKFGKLKIKSIRYICGSLSSITIWLDEDVLKSNEQISNWLLYSMERATSIRESLQKSTGLIIGLPYPISNGHIDRRLREGVARSWIELGFDEEIEKIDFSKGPDKPTWETTDGQKAINLKTVPQRIDSLEEDTTRIYINTKKMASEIRKNTEKLKNDKSIIRSAQDDFNQAVVEFNKEITEKVVQNGDKKTTTEAESNYHEFMYW